VKPVYIYIYVNPHTHTHTHIYMQGVPGVKVNNLGFNFRADAESKSHIHKGLIGNGSGVTRF